MRCKPKGPSYPAFVIPVGSTHCHTVVPTVYDTTAVFFRKKRRIRRDASTAVDTHHILASGYVAALPRCDQYYILPHFLGNLSLVLGAHDVTG